MPFSAAIGAVGDLVGGGISANANAKEASKNRDWQAMMAGSAHQRQVADMRAAGLNPIMSGMGGSGAATGSGAQASMPDMSSIGSRAVSSASQGQQRKLAKEQTDLMSTETKNKKAHQKQIADDPDLMNAQLAKQMGLGDDATTALVALKKAQREGKSIATGKERIMENLKADWENIKAQNAKAKSAAQLKKDQFTKSKAQRVYRWTNKPFHELYKWGRKKMDKEKK